MFYIAKYLQALITKIWLNQGITTTMKQKLPSAALNIKKSC